MATNVDALLPGPWRALVTFEPVQIFTRVLARFNGSYLSDINSRLVQALALHVFSRSLMRIAEVPRTSCSYLELPGRVISILLS